MIVRALAWLVRAFTWLFGAALNADGATLTAIEGEGENVESITLRMGQGIRSFRIVPNRGDLTVEDVSTTIGGGASGDAYVGLGPYVSEPGNPLAFTLTPLAPTPAGVPSVLGWQFDSATEPGETQTVAGSISVTVLPENADGATVEPIV